MAVEQASQVYLFSIHQFRVAPEIPLCTRWGFSATWYVLTDTMNVQPFESLTRFIVTKLHPWLPFFYALVMFMNWSRDMKIWEIEAALNGLLDRWGNSAAQNQLMHFDLEAYNK